ncbi:MAG: hypothetical protein GXP55_22085 [Deltaproteobacteria bacterium]|nr:hypothetical protein [Deltaproteobacteria bacterium]
MTADSSTDNAPPAAAPAACLPAPGDPDALYLIDISAFIFRAYHALPPLSNSKGEATGAVAGVAQMLMRFFDEHQPARVIVAYDSPGPTLRKQRYPDYKANRPPAPPDLKSQIVRIHELVSAWGLCGLEAPGYEADDVIASVVPGARDIGLSTVILSGDKDLLQLVGPSVVMYDPMREKVFGVAETIEKLGVHPRRVRDLLALMGDSSDNIPGVPKVGLKTAGKLLAQYESFDGVFAHADEVKGKLGERLREHRDLAELSRDLVTLYDEVPLDFGEEQIRAVPPNAAALRPFFRELELSRLEARLGRVEAPPAEALDVPILRDAASVASFAARVREAGRVALFSVVADASPLRSHAVGLALALSPRDVAYVPLGHRALDSGAQPGGEDLARPARRPRSRETQRLPRAGERGSDARRRRPRRRALRCRPRELPAGLGAPRPRARAGRRRRARRQPAEPRVLEQPAPRRAPASGRAGAGTGQRLRRQPRRRGLRAPRHARTSARRRPLGRALPRHGAAPRARVGRDGVARRAHRSPALRAHVRGGAGRALGAGRAGA